MGGVIDNILGLVSFGLVSIFSLLYLSSSLPKKPPAIEKALELIRANLSLLALAAMIYGFAAFCLAMMLVPLPLTKLLNMGAGILLIVMGLPLMFDRLASGKLGQLNAAILKELKNSVNMITANEGAFGIVGALVAGGLIYTAIMF